MTRSRQQDRSRFRAYERRDLGRIPQLAGVLPDDLLAMRAVSAVLPFRVNEYVLDHLIDWRRVPEDPMFQLTFPQRGMLEPDDFSRMASLVAGGATAAEVQQAARAIQRRMNPHPAGQTTLNVPDLDGAPIAGMQHKYRETVLFFPSQGQTCHAYCSYCFRWPQFVGLDEEKLASREAHTLTSYLRAHPEVTSVLFTGGDPLVMKTAVLRRYIEPLLEARLPNLASIRIGTKAPSYWPHRFLTDPDADELLRVFEQVGQAGLHLALMAHVTIPREIETPEAQHAIRRIRSTGAVVRCQSPIVRHVNDDGVSWADMWRLQVQLGAVPYYMFVQRDTGPRAYFEVPLLRAHEVFREALQRVSGLGRTVRGPSMSATPGKLVVDGVTQVGPLRAFVLRYLQARDPDLVGRPFLAHFDPKATWFDQLTPLSADDERMFGRAADRTDSWKVAPLERRRLPVHVSLADVA